ncbi:MAG TPA: hypothetical protein VFZ76_03805 [Anaerolineales bacterium]
MNTTSLSDLEKRLYEDARSFVYPSTPDIASSVSWHSHARSPFRAGSLLGSRLAMAITLLLVILTGLMAVPAVRAQILEFLQIGSIRIFLDEPAPSPSPALTASPSAVDPGAFALPPTATPAATLTPLPSLLNLSSQSTLIQAQDQVDFPIRLPGYPYDLGAPDHVFLEHLGGSVVVLVWLQPDQPDDVQLSLMQLSPGAFIEKTPPQVIVEVEVNAQPAIWTEGPHHLRYLSSSGPVDLIVAGNVLIWQEGEITFRLAGDFTLDEAVKIAESLR